MEAILLVGGQGTRLHPLTLTVAKPLLPVVNATLTEHQIAIAKSHGIERIILGTSYKAESFQEVLGDGSHLGVEIDYAYEPEPLGTGGAIRNAATKLHSGPTEPVAIFNGDILSQVNITHLVQAFYRHNADVILYLTRVSDPRNFGLVPTALDGRVIAFTEKPQTDAEIISDQINAGVYIFKRSAIDEIPADTVVSVERDVFPRFLREGFKVFADVQDCYWLDLGTPQSFIKGAKDLVSEKFFSPIFKSSNFLYWAERSSRINPTALIGGGSSIGANCNIGSNNQINASVLMDSVQSGAEVIIEDSIISSGVKIADGVSLKNSVIGAGAQIAKGAKLVNCQVWPDFKVSGEFHNAERMSRN
jgi:mannose-1-phosphate guanylyltransferase